MVKKYRKGSSMLSEVLLQQLEENQKETLSSKLFGEHTETLDMKVPEIRDEQVREADKVLLAAWEKCPFCKKVLDELHIMTPLHERTPPVQLLAGRSHLHVCRGSCSSEAI